MKTNYINICFATGTLIGYSAVAQTTNNVGLPHLSPESDKAFFDLEKNQQDNTLSEKFVMEFDHKSSVMFSDSFGWQSDLNWVRAYNLNSDYNSKISQTDLKVTGKVMFNSLRDSFVQLPLISDSKNWFNQTFINSFGRTTEESINTMNSSSIANQESWWNEIRSSGDIVYGFRPLDGNVYCSARFGHWSDTPIGIAFARIHIDPVVLRSSIDDQVSFFLPWSSMLTFGMSFGLTDLHNNQHDINWSLTITHAPVKKILGGCELFAGISTNNHELLASTGLHWSY